MESKLQEAVYASDPEFIMRLQALQRELERKLYEWELLSEQVDSLKQSE